MSKVYLMTGIIASGKSTWARQHVDSNTFIVSKDVVREMIYGNYNYKYSDEVLIDKLTRSLIRELIYNSCNIIIDECWDTMTEGARCRLSEWLRKQGEVYIYIIFCSSIKGNIDRQVKSKGWPKELAIEVYNKMIREFEPPIEFAEEVEIK